MTIHPNNSQNKEAGSQMEITTYPVLIVGRSLVGLSASLFLSSHGTPSILIERHQSTSIHPRAAGYNLRTMELFRSVGLEQIIHDAGRIITGSGGILVVESLAGKEIGWFEPPCHKYSDKDILSTEFFRLPAYQLFFVYLLVCWDNNL